MPKRISSKTLAAKPVVIVAAILLVIICTTQALGLTQKESDFPQGYDAVAAAPRSHRVIFENALVRVLEVTLPRAGEKEPMHHHH